MNSQNIDSLRIKLDKHFQNEEWVDAKSTIDIMLDGFSKMGQWDSIKRYNDQIFELGKKTDNLEWIIKGQLEKNSIQLYFEPQSKKLLNQRRAIYELIDTNRLEAAFLSSLYQGLQRYLSDQGKQDSAFQMSKKAMYFAEKSENPTHIVMSKMGHSNSLMTDARYGEAIETLIEADKIIANEYIDDIIKIRVYIRLSDALRWISDFEKAHFYIEKARRLANRRDYQMFQADADFYQGLIFTAEHKWQDAKQITDKAIEYYRAKSVTPRLISCYKSQLYTTINQEDFKTFDQYMLQLESLNGTDNPFVKILIARRLLSQGDTKKVKKAISQLKDIKDISLQDRKALLRLEYKYEEAVGNPIKALERFKAYRSLQDSINENNQAAIAHRIESEYNRKQQDTQIESLEKIRLAQDKALAVRNIALVIGSIMLLILLTLLYFLYNLFKKNQKIQLQLAEQNTQITAALQENQMLIKEVHHRVKNNLQVVSSLLSMQERKVTDEDTKDALKTSKTRVQSMSILHQNLYSGENLTEIEADQYFNQLVNNIKDTYGLEGDIHFALNVENIGLDVDTLIPVGLIVNELVTNAIKHAFKDQKDKKIEVNLTEQDNLLTLQVKDNGLGLKDKTLPRKTGSLGARLINSFTKRLNGDMKVQNNEGTSITISFNKDNLIIE